MYSVSVTRAAQRQIAALPPDVQRRVYAAIQDLAHNLRPHGCKRLTNEPFWSLRIGRYRVIYDIDDPVSLVIVIRAMHRRDVYR